MRDLKSLAVLCLLAAVCAIAQAEPELNGKWRATFATEGSDGREAEVIIDGAGGTWMTYARGNKDKRDACVGRALPIVIADSGSSTVSLRIEASKALEGCKDRKARLTRVDAKTLEGEFDNGRVIKLVRQ